MALSEEQMETDSNALRELVEKLQKENEVLKASLLNCIHPGCCCVCGHKGKCPEDGPSHIEGVHD